jgi:hypothetical protein
LQKCATYHERRRFFKKFTTYDDDGCQVMAIAHMTLWVRWANNIGEYNTTTFIYISCTTMHQPTWPLLLKIELMVKLQVLGNNSKTVNNIKNLTWGKNDQHIKIYLPCNFEVLKFWKFDEKREITPKWVMGFTSKLQGG